MERDKQNTKEIIIILRRTERDEVSCDDMY